MRTEQRVRVVVRPGQETPALRLVERGVGGAFEEGGRGFGSGRVDAGHGVGSPLLDGNG